MRIAIIVIIVSFIFALFNSIQFFSAIAQQPPETVYLGTVHYYEDYFFYLNHFYQGANGGWLTKNQFTSESTKPSVIYWSNVLMGKIGGIFGLTPILSYNIFLIITAFITLLASFFVIRLILKNDQKALIGFIFSTFATSFMNYIFVDGKPIWYPFQLWRTPHFTFDRLGGAPHQILQTLLFYFLFLSLFSYQRKIQWFSPIIGILLTTINPVLSVLLLLFTWLIKLITRAVAWLFEHRHSHSSLTTPRFSLFAQHAALITTTLLTFITYFLLLRTLDSLPHLQSKLWEANQQSTTTPLFLLLSIGPVVVFFVAGILPAVARRNDLLIIAVLLPVICYFLFMSKIPSVFGFSNARIIFPALYAFMGAIAAEGLFWIAYRFFFIVTRLSLIAYRLSLIGLFLLLSLPTLQWELQEKAKITEDKKIPFIYMPNELYEGFIELSKRLPHNDIVLANPTSHIDILVPALSGHTTYSGHFLTTINNTEKVSSGRDFYTLSINPAVARQWLSDNRIHYIVFTYLDGNIKTFLGQYSFLKPVIANSAISVFTY